MNQIAGRFAHNVPRILVMTAIATAVTLVVSFGASASDTDPAASPGVQSTAHASRMSAHKETVEETAEDRIKYLHSALKITPAQEDQWTKVAVVMRENADQITILAKARSENSKSMTAVDDLKSYAEFASAHEDGTKKLIPVFQVLYDGMSGSQQKTADMVFRNNSHSGPRGAGHPAS
jgi:hypothetical protein